MVSENLVQDKEKRSKQKRSLSVHVVSRQYRPPEIILMEKQYDAKIDVWSVGCIFADLLNCLHN